MGAVRDIVFGTKKNADSVLQFADEAAYFNAYLLPIAQKANLQSAINTHGAVRLEKGDYSGYNVTMTTNQRLYGHPSLTQVSDITIVQGSSNVHLENLFPFGQEVIFQAGGAITNCTLKTIRWATIKATNAIVENNLFINIMSNINFDCSLSGYFRNNKIIKHQVHGTSNQLVMKGNSTTPSYGNVHLHSNFLTPAGDATDIDNLQSATFVGLDSEAWNFSGTGTKPMLWMQNMGDVKITDFGGGNGYSTVQTAALNIDADNLFFFNKYIQSEGTSPSSIVAAKTNVLYFEGQHDEYVRGSGTVTGFDLKGHFNDGTNYKEITYNGVVQNTAISNPTVLSNAIKGTQHTPWARPIWETLPNPLGANWATIRVGKPDSTSYIQNLINTNGIAELAEGTFYISSTLSMTVDGTKGIIGQGTGKTVLVGLTDSFPLITLVESATGDNNFILANLTLQGGSVGVYAPDAIDMIAFTNLKFLVFRNQNYGIHLYRIFGVDNCFLDNVSFVDCNIGFFQDPHPTYTFENAGYVDKVLFYNGQYINCNTAVSMKATRANNLDAWVNCKFNGNNLAIDMSGNNFPIAANCDFTNHSGEYVIKGEIAYYNCKFQSNTPTKAILFSKLTFIEGCDFLDTVKLFPEELHYLASYYILNSTINSDVSKTYGINQSVFVNSNLMANPTLSKLLVSVKDNVPTVLVNQTPNPYPQLLVTKETLSPLLLAGETAYFNAYLLPLSERANLQTALNTYGSVRLEEGNYRVGGVSSVNLSSNMSLYGHPSYNEMPEINIVAGATNVAVSSVKVWYGLNFLSGAAITNCTISHVLGGDISATNALIENCRFVDIIGSNLMVNNTSSGYFRNNKLIKHWITSVYPQLSLKGNNTTPSYGNTWAWLNLLTAHGDATDIDNFGNMNIIGLDAEAWNFNDLGTGKALFHMRNMTDVKIASMSGLGYAINSTPVFDIQANNLMLLSKEISTNGGASVTTAKSLAINSNTSPYSVTGGNHDTRGHFANTAVSYNGANQTSLLSGTPATDVANSILGAVKQQWSRPVFETLPNPTGASWNTTRIGQTSSRAYIQGLIDTNGIATLPEGIFYIDAPLLLNLDEGIVGSGTGKTAIVGLTDDFNLINVRGAGIGSFTINFLTLQGGNKGVHITSDGYDVWFQPNGISFNYVVLRDQATYGIEVAQMYGMDNNMFQQIHFVNIPTAFKQTPDPAFGGFETNHMTYIDKTVFYQCQVINCGVGFSLRTTRADNLNAWIECNFDNNTTASIDLNNHNAPIVINCDFKNNTGTRIINSGQSVGLYSCNFSNNSTTAVLTTASVIAEGCSFLDAIPLFETNADAYLINSTITGTVANINNGLLVNSTASQNPTLSKLLVNIIGGTPTVLLNQTPTPYPQLLVAQ